MPDPVEQCATPWTKGDLSFAENGVVLHVSNKRGSGCRKIKVDGCLPMEGAKCDWLAEGARVVLLVELKGGHVDRAVEQLRNTLRWLNGNNYFQRHGKRCLIVTNGRGPRDIAKAQRQKDTFRGKLNAKLEVVRSGRTVPLEA